MKKVHTIMIVDDDPDDIIIFKEAIREIDPTLESIQAIDGEKAILYLNKTDALPDIIFLDLNMPRIQGMQCLAEIKHSLKLRKIPVVIYSTTRNPETEKEARNQGAEYYITKPVFFKDICNAIITVIDDINYQQIKLMTERITS